MPLLYVREFSEVALDSRGEVMQLPKHPAVVTQAPVSFTSASGASAAFNDATHIVEIRADTNCHYVVGTSPVATTNDMTLEAGETRFIGVQPGQGFQVAARTSV